ncbi:MAG: hypothetical protein CVT94_13465 [Bacteroidetes bacterium HGW-Bacteroidetes-11]|jgi:hypothetical protein|nr:MAG: hypothetical protein CVT94_13465 [Bacteroidetes bacterium HGW-Bacteroidetes-11]
MARSIETIYSLIIAQKEATPELNALDSTSVTSIYRMWAWVTAAVLFTVESMFDLFRFEITTLLETLKPGTLLWYQAMCKAFQYGDALVWENGKYGYPAINEAALIVKQCSVSEGERGLVVKIATEVAGELEPLSSPQESSFTAYLQRRKYAGTKVSIVNSAANKLRIDGAIFYDPLIIASNGVDISSGLRTVDLAIQNYLRSLPFNGRLKITAIVDAIQSVEGVYDVSVTAQHQYGVAAYSSIPVSHIPESGYFKIDAAYPLSSTLNYQANV